MGIYNSTTFLIVMTYCTALAIQATADIRIQSAINEDSSLEFFEVILVDIINTATAKPLIIIVFDDSQDTSNSFQKISVLDTLDRLEMQVLLVEENTLVKIFSSRRFRIYKDNVFVFGFFNNLSWSTLLNIHDADILYGNKFTLRHFTKWIIIDTNHQSRSIIQPIHGVIQDHVVLIATRDWTSLNGTNTLMQSTSKTDIRAFTLLWTEEGREWNQIHIDAHNVVKRLFPNTKYGLNRRELLLAVLPWTPSLKIDDANRTKIYRGASVNIITALAQKFNFSYRFVSPGDRQWGTELNHSWTGIIGMLQRGEADLCPVPYARNPDRNQVLEFSILFAYEPTHVVYKSISKGQRNWKLLLAIFKWEIYATGVACLVYVLGLILILQRIHCISNPSGPAMSSSDILLIGVGPPLKQGLTRTPSAQSSRILLGFWWIFCVIITSIYSSQLTAGFTTPADTVSFSSLDQLARDNDYRIGLNSFSFLSTVFQNSNSSVYRTLSARTKKNCSPKLMNSTMETACHKKNLREGGYAFITSSYEISGLKAEICHLSVMRETVLASSTGMIFPRHSPLAELFSTSLLTMGEFGLIDKWTTEHTPRPKKCTIKMKSAAVVNINMFLSVVFTCCFVILLAVINLIMEICSQSYCT